MARNEKYNVILEISGPKNSHFSMLLIFQIKSILNPFGRGKCQNRGTNQADQNSDEIFQISDPKNSDIEYFI